MSHRELSRREIAQSPAAGCGATGYSLFTDYELGLVKALPMKAHLTLDALSGGALIGAALMLGDEDPEVRATLAGIGAWEIAAALLTRTARDGVGSRSDATRAAGAGAVESGSWSQQSMPSAPASAHAASPEAAEV